MVVVGAARGPSASVFANATADFSVGTDVVVGATIAVVVHISAVICAHIASHVVDRNLADFGFSGIGILRSEVAFLRSEPRESAAHGDSFLWCFLMCFRDFFLSLCRLPRRRRSLIGWRLCGCLRCRTAGYFGSFETSIHRCNAIVPSGFVLFNIASGELVLDGNGDVFEGEF